VYVQHVLGPITPVPGIDMEHSFNYHEKPYTFQQVEKTLQEILAKIDKVCVPCETVVSRGPRFLEIIRTARENDVDMIVIATHGRTGLAHILLDSKAERVVRKAPCPVLTV
jgi:nucleotide-binding universal stress UspA family protein